MNVIDLTYVISPDMPVYPGTEGPKLSPANTYEKDGFKETLLSMYSHTGTHMDAPAHLFAHCSTLDALPAGQFAGQAVVVDCSDLGEGGRITMDYVNRTPGTAEAEYLLFRTGWGKYWGKPEYFGDYPCVTPEVVDFLIATNKKGVGLDTIGLDPIAAADFLNTVRKINIELGTTIIITEHRLEDIYHCADRVVVMDGGSVAMDGTPRQILTRMEELRAIGLDVPHTVELLHGLRAEGFDVPVDALTVSECADVICAALKK